MKTILNTQFSLLQAKDNVDEKRINYFKKGIGCLWQTDEEFGDVVDECGDWWSFSRENLNTELENRLQWVVVGGKQQLRAASIHTPAQRGALVAEITDFN